MAKFYVTYGNGTKQAQKFSVVERDTLAEAVNYVFCTIGQAWAFIYTEETWKEHPTKQTQAERFGLTEIPLQAHEKY